MTIDIWTDGSCDGLTKRGGWSFVIPLSSGGNIIESGSVEDSTNNRMELEAVIKSLQFVNEMPMINVCEIIIHSDSRYVVQGASEWAAKWQINNWRTYGGKPVENKDLWIILLDELKGKQVKFVLVDGHKGNNNIAHSAAYGAMKG